jgi:glycosyltransferase involved in cell wall biosynthesis
MVDASSRDTPCPATRRRLVTEKPRIFGSPEVPHAFFLPEGAGRVAAGGLRTKGLFKAPDAAKPLVTVITVVYNGAEYLAQTVESVINQRYDNLEYIVIDGGSTDGTLELLRRYDDVIDYWVSEPDAGIYDAMNKGAMCGSGAYLLFLNARDELAVDLEEIADALAGDCVLLYGRANMLEENRRIAYVKGKELKSARKLITGTPLCHQAIFYRRSAIGTYDLRYSIVADRVLTYEMIVKYGLDRTRFLDTVIANYFEGGFSRQHQDRWKREEIAFLRSVGWHLYAEYKRLGWLWKKLRKVPR